MEATKESQTSRILKMFKSEGRLTNVQLNRVAFRYGARIKELRDDGYIIVTNRLKGGLFEFVYRGHVEDKVREFAD